MKPYWTILVCLCLFCVVSGNKRNKPADAAGRRRSEGRTVPTDIIDIDNTAAEFEGSGTDMDIDENDDTEASGDDLEESSGVPLVDLTECQRKSVGITSGTPRRLGQFIPQCAPDGSYESKQCHERECWCVNRNDGQEIFGSRRRAPQVPDCVSVASPPVVSSSRSPTTTSARVTTTVTVPSVSTSTQRTSHGGSVKTRTSSSSSPTTRQSTTVSTTTTRYSEPDNKINQIPNESDDVQVDREPDIDSNYVEKPNIIIEPKARKLTLRSTIIGQPGILAGIIGAAVTVLLCLVLLVMFIIYRMHRKSQDPAIYYIDKPARSTLQTSNKKAGYMKALDHDVYT